MYVLVLEINIKSKLNINCAYNNSPIILVIFLFFYC